VGRYIQFDPLGITPGLIPLAPVFNRVGMPMKKPTVSSVNLYLTSHGLNNPYAYVNNKPLRYTDPMGLDAELCSRPFYPYPTIFARHCFIRFSGGGSSSFTNDGVGPDAAPNWWPKSCQPTKGDQDDDCIKREMQKCQASQYDFTGFNCCHCTEQAMRACGQWIPSDSWPNYPVNPGPKIGEP